jgi:hypothetical protein
MGLGIDFIRDGFIRAGLARKALFLATGGLSGFVLKSDHKRRPAAKRAATGSASAAPAKASRAKGRKAARPSATKPIHKTRPQAAKATRAKAAKATRAKPQRARASAKAPARAAATPAQPPAATGPIRIERVGHLHPAGALTADRPTSASAERASGGEPIARPDPAIARPSGRPDEATRDPATYNAVQASAEAARRLAEMGRDEDRSSAPFAVNGGNDASS